MALLFFYKDWIASSRSTVTATRLGLRDAHRQGVCAPPMRQFNGVYTQRFNRTHGRVGHVFQGRFKAILVDKDSYLLELARYVVLNPLRANMVPRLEQWPWSSFPATCGQTAKPDWLEVDFVLAQFSTQRARAIEKYVAFVHEGAKLPSVWEQLQGQVYLGSESHGTTLSISRSFLPYLFARAIASNSHHPK